MFRFYVSAFHGALIPDEEAFRRVRMDAQAITDALITNREPLQYAPVRERYNCAVCAAAESLYEAMQSAQDKIAGESVGNHSVTYKAAKSEAESRKDAVRRVRTFLQGTGLLYGGLK